MAEVSFRSHFLNYRTHFRNVRAHFWSVRTQEWNVPKMEQKPLFARLTWRRQGAPLNTLTRIEYNNAIPEAMQGKSRPSKK